MHNLINRALEKHFHKKNTLVTQSLQNGKFRWNQDSSKEKGKKSATCSLFSPITWGPLASLTKIINTHNCSTIYNSQDIKATEMSIGR